MCNALTNKNLRDGSVMPQTDDAIGEVAPSPGEFGGRNTYLCDSDSDCSFRDLQSTIRGGVRGRNTYNCESGADCSFRNLQSAIHNPQFPRAPLRVAAKRLLDDASRILSTAYFLLPTDH